MTLQVGPVSIADPVILAPMSGVTDLPFRRLVKSFGAGLVVSEMIASRAMIRANQRTRRRAASCAEEAPMAVQLAGCEPEVMAEAAKLCRDRGAAIIDINFGCPAKKVVAGAAGSALMRDERQAARIIEAVVQSVELPVTLKMRTGWDAGNRNAPRLAKIAEEAGVRMIAVHGRTRCQLYDGQADWPFIGQVKRAVRIPVIGNGDVACLDDAALLLRVSGADGVMIGRGVRGRPWLIRQVSHFLRTGERLADPPLGERAEILLRHFDAMLSHYGIERGLRIARKHLGWYLEGVAKSTAARARLVKLTDPGRVRDGIRVLFDRAFERAGGGGVRAAAGAA